MLQQDSGESIAGLMASFRRGDRGATDQLVRIFYPELRRLANSRMRGEREGHSWQPTVLVNELYLELIRIKALPGPDGDDRDAKAAFFGLAARIMCRLLIHHSRPQRLESAAVNFNDDDLAVFTSPLVEIESVLDRLEAIRPRLRAIVELKVFEEMTLAEIAGQLNCSTATVTREWSFARHLLRREMGV
jgi:RNA polymerase sigma factor (TIGR02999 family)